MSGRHIGLEKWTAERNYEMGKRKLWQELRADWHLKVGDNQALYDQVAVCWKEGYDKGYKELNDGHS